MNASPNLSRQVYARRLPYFLASPNTITSTSPGHVDTEAALRQNRCTSLFGIETYNVHVHTTYEKIHFSNTVH